jgi:hypothetical protein
MNHEPHTPSNDLQYFLTARKYGIGCFFMELLRYAELTTILYRNQKIERGAIAPIARETRHTAS